MALFIDDINRSSASQLFSDSLVHSYNKKCFSDYDVAVQTLLNKVLLPGEVAFAYYYDPISEYGQSAIAAVGSLTHGTGNIIFKNADDIERIKERLYETIADVNASINYLREDIYDDLLDTLNHVNSSIDELWNNVQGPMNIYDQRITNLELNFITNNSSLNNYINSSITEIKNIMNTSFNDLSDLLDDVSNGLYNKIIDTSNYIIKYVDKTFAEGFGNIGTDTSSLVNNTSNNLAVIINNFKTDINNYINEENNKQNYEISNLRYEINDLNVSVNYNTDQFRIFKHLVEHYFDTSYISSVVDSLIERLDQSYNELKESIPTNYEETINGFANDVSFIKTYASYDKWHNISTGIDILNEKVSIFEHKLSHFMSDTDRTVIYTGNYDISLGILTVLNTSVNNIENNVSMLISKIEELLNKVHDLEGRLP